MAEGPALVGEAVAAGWDIESQFVAPDGEAVGTAPAFPLAPGVLERVATTEQPRGPLAVVRMPRRGVDLSTLDFVLVADQLADPGNLGTILRSAEAAGADAVVLTPGSVDVYNPKVLRASAGAVFHVPVTTATLDDVRAARFRVVGSSSHHGAPHDAADWGGRVALVVGNEAHGLSPSADVDEWVTIVHRGRSESLNVAMAATILLFEAAGARAVNPLDGAPDAT